MKSYLSKISLLTFIIILLINYFSICLTLNRELKNNKKAAAKKPEKKKEPKVITPLDRLTTDLSAFFDAKLKPMSPKKTDDKKGNITYDIPSKKTKITMAVSGTKMIVTLTNEYESQSIELENVEFEDQKELIENEYVNSFLGHTEQVETEINSIFAAIEQGLLASSFNGSFGETGFSKLTKKAAKGKKKGAADNIEFSMDYLNKTLTMAGDPILGELKKVKNKYLLIFSTKFFQKTFELGILTKGYLSSESVKMGTRVLSHLDSMYYLNENPNEESISRSFLFDEYSSHMKDISSQFLGPDFSVEVKDKTLSISFDGKPVANIVVKESMLNDMAFIVFKGKIDVLSSEHVSLVLPNQAIFAMEALADKYVMDMMDRVKHAVNKAGANETVLIFE